MYLFIILLNNRQFFIDSINKKYINFTCAFNYFYNNDNNSCNDIEITIIPKIYIYF